jgi:hypothetical protein
LCQYCISCDQSTSTYNDGDVDVGSLLDSLGISARVGNDDQARLLERAGDVVSEVTGGEATGDGNGTGVSGELEDGTLTVGTGRDDANCSRRQPNVVGAHFRKSAFQMLKLQANTYCRPGCRWRQ